MTKINNEYVAGKYRVLVLSNDLPLKPFKNIKIDGVCYNPEIVYGVSNEIGVVSSVSLKGKSVEFVWFVEI